MSKIEVEGVPALGNDDGEPVVVLKFSTKGVQGLLTEIQNAQLPAWVTATAKDEWTVHLKFASPADVEPGVEAFKLALAYTQELRVVTAAKQTREAQAAQATKQREEAEKQAMRDAITALAPKAK